MGLRLKDQTDDRLNRLLLNQANYGERFSETRPSLEKETETFHRRKIDCRGSSRIPLWVRFSVKNLIPLEYLGPAPESHPLQGKHK